MTNRSRLKSKGRRTCSSFVAMPHDCLNHDNFIKLSPYALKLLMDIAAQYKGFNNGDFCITWTMMRERGWRSRDTLERSCKELLHYGWIAQTRQGGRNMASLYCITWQPIDDCKGKLDFKPPAAALGYWRKPVEEFNRVKVKKSNTADVTTNTPLVLIGGGKA